MAYMIQIKRDGKTDEHQELWNDTVWADNAQSSGSQLQTALDALAKARECFAEEQYRLVQILDV